MSAADVSSFPAPADGAHRANEPLRWHPRLDAATLDAADECVLVLDLQQSIVRANLLCRQLLGVRGGELVGQPFPGRLTPAAEGAAYDAFLKQLRQEKVAGRFAGRLLNPRGPEYAIAWVGKCVGDESGAAEFLVLSGSVADASCAMMGR